MVACQKAGTKLAASIELVVDGLLILPISVKHGKPCCFYRNALVFVQTIVVTRELDENLE